MIDENIPSEEKDKVLEWKKSLESGFKTGLEFEGFQEIIWRGYLNHKLNFENMQKTLYDKNSEMFECLRNYRAARMKKIMLKT